MDGWMNSGMDWWTMDGDNVKDGWTEREKESEEWVDEKREGVKDEQMDGEKL